MAGLLDALHGARAREFSRTAPNLYALHMAFIRAGCRVEVLR